MSESRIRTFIAVELCDDAKAEAGLLISAVEKMGIHGVRAVRPRGIHLTLRFLGDIDRDAVPGVIAAIRAAASRSHPFDLALGDVGAFPNPGSARVLWIGVDGDTGSLGELRESVEDELSGAGFRRDKRRFNPHITLARLRDRVAGSDRRRVIRAVSGVAYARIGFSVEEVTLFQTTLHPEGSIHTPLCRAQLGE